MATNAAAEELFLEGIELSRNQKHYEALKKYKKAAGLDPTSAVYKSFIAVCHLNFHDLAESKRCFQESIELDASNAKMYYHLADLQRQLWEYEDALETVERGLEVDSTYADLLELKSNILETLQSRQKLHKATLSIPEQDFVYFGGLQPGGTCEIPRDSAYFQLPRPALPPYSKKHKTMTYVDERVKFVFDCFCSGDLEVQWSETDNIFQLEGYIPHNQAPVIVLGNAMMPSGKMCLSFGTDQNQTYNNCLAADQKEQLKFVLLQRFFRSKGSMLAWQTVAHICKAAAEECGDFDLYKDAIDFYLISVDIVYNKNSMIPARMAELLGIALESAKQYRAAAGVYLDIADGKLVLTDSTNYPEESARCDAGLAFKRDMDYVRAEREYVGALRVLGRHWHWKRDVAAKTILQNIVFLYDIVHRAVNSGFRTDESHKMMQQTCFVLFALLSVAGYESTECTLFQEQAVSFQAALKQKYKSPRAAFRVVVSATATPTIEEYHRVLFGARKENVVLMAMPDINQYAAQQELVRNQKRTAKSSARETQKSTTGSPAIERCDNCWEYAGVKLQQCPCHLVRYCSKKCQVAHFPYHKKHCPYIKAKRQHG